MLNVFWLLWVRARYATSHPMEDAPHYNAGPDTAEQMRQALARTLHQLADCIEAAPTDLLPDILMLVAPTAAELFKKGKMV